MKIYTYYEEISYDDMPDFEREHHEQLLELWKKDWTDKGFKPVVLGSKHAESHPHYDGLMKNIEKMSSQLAKWKDINTYEMACFKRWFAYATQPNYFLTSDYDVFTDSFNPFRLDEKTQQFDVEDRHGNVVNKQDMTFFAAFCPCLQAGNQKQYDKIAVGFESVTKKRFEVLSEIYSNEEYKIKCHLHPHGGYHDQDFFVVNLSAEFMNSKRHDLIKEYQLTHRHYKGWEHFSKHYVLHKREELKRTDQNWMDLRIELIKNYINIK